MHNWKIKTSGYIPTLEDFFKSFSYETDHRDCGYDECKGIKIWGTIYSDETKANTELCNRSYGDDYAHVAPYISGKTSKVFSNVFNDYITKRKDYLSFKKDLNIGYGRKSNKVTCPKCESSISLKYGSRFTKCPVCGSEQIISDSNWNRLETKKNIMLKAAAKLKTEIEKCNGYFIAGFEWHS